MKFFRPSWMIAASLILVGRGSSADTPQVPDWAQPGSATHKQVPPPSDFHRPSTTYHQKLGLFKHESDVGSAVLPGSAVYDATLKQYTITSAGYNIWYNRDEFYYLWKQMSGDISLATDISFPNSQGYGDRKVVLVIRQSLDDDSPEVMVALHGAGLIHLALRPEKNANIKETFRIEAATSSSVSSSGPKSAPIRLGLQKQGDAFTLYVSDHGEPLHAAGPAAMLHLKEPFYVGIGFCSHLPDKADTAVVSRVILENSAGKVH